MLPRKCENAFWSLGKQKNDIRELLLYKPICSLEKRSSQTVKQNAKLFNQTSLLCLTYPEKRFFAGKICIFLFSSTGQQ